MAKPVKQMTQDAYKPITEGYQPGRGQPLQKGYTPTPANEAAQQTQPPSGGSSAAKPAQK